MQIIIAKQNYLKKMGEELKYIDSFDVYVLLFRNYSIRCVKLQICARIARLPHNRPPFSLPKRKNDYLYIEFINLLKPFPMRCDK